MTGEKKEGVGKTVKRTQQNRAETYRSEIKDTKLGNTLVPRYLIDSLLQQRSDESQPSVNQSCKTLK